ncbi:MAG TPA: HEAT repeat domain-containing protein [Caulobacteraceae bacterium]|nr:HEAT repeat domain-containing protein [Caulobacteraceae bacterium]
MVDQDLIEELAVPHRVRAAYQRLLQRGAVLIPLVRANLRHPSASVREYCCKFLDHYVDEDALGELIAMLDDPDPKVRASSLHALACDRCKEGTCRPDEALVLPQASRLLSSDADAHVRAHAVGVVGLSVHTRCEAEAALVSAASEDPSPMVRKKAKWYLPGGPIYRRTAPRTPRRPRRTGQAAQ